MNYKATILALGSFFLAHTVIAEDSIVWDTAKAHLSATGTLSVEVTVSAQLDNTQGTISLYLQDDEKPLGDPQEANVTVAKGHRTLFLKRTIQIPRNLTEVYVWTPLYVGSASSTSITQMGTLKISWQNPEKPSVTIILPE